MDRNRLVALNCEGSTSSGYVIGPRLVLASAHGVGPVGTGLHVIRPGRTAYYRASVVWRGTPEGRDDAALVHVDAPDWLPVAGTAEPWGRMTTTRVGQACETWGIPEVVQTPADESEELPPLEAVQLSGTINPGSGFVGNRHLFALSDHSITRWSPGKLPWAGLSGAAVVSGGLLIGVVKAQVRHFGHGMLDVVPSYVLHADDSFRNALKDYGADSLTMGDAEFDELRRRDTPGPSIGPVPPGSLLEAGRQVVGFHGREDILDRLGQWCEAPGFGVRLLYGPGGQGKTRLAARLAEELVRHDKQWRALWPAATAPGTELQGVRDTAKPMLVVLDYAEARQDQLEGLLTAGELHRGGVPLKVLLLARTAGEWWDIAKGARYGAALRRAPVDGLPELAPDEESRASVYRRAASAFAERLADPDDTSAQATWRARAASLPEPPPGTLASGNVLTLHMTALADLLDAGPGGSRRPADGPAADDRDAEARILEHEQMYWTQVAERFPLARGIGRPPVLGEALATVVLLGGTALDEEEREDLLRRAPMLAGLEDHEAAVVRAWIESVYPSPTERPWEILQPDRLAERFVGTHVLTNRRLLHKLLSPKGVAGDVTDAQCARVLTLLARAAAHPPLLGTLDDLITEVCTRHAERLGRVTMDVATQVERPQPLIDALWKRTEAAETSMSVLADFTDHLPRSSHVLAPWALRLTERTIELRRAAGTGSIEDTIALGVEYRRLAGKLTDMGRSAEALTAAERAVELLEPLLRTRPEAVRIHLAAALNNRAVCLGLLGKRREALEPARQAVAHYRVAASGEPVPGDALRQLVTALSSLSSAQSQLGQNSEALETMAESVAFQRVLAQDGTPGAAGNLVLWLNNLSIRCTDVGHYQDALMAAAEAVAVCEPLAEQYPDAHRADLAMALNTLSSCYGDVGDRAKGLQLSRRSVDIRERLHLERPEAYGPSLALALNSLSINLGRAGLVEEALETAERSVALYEVVCERQDGYRHELAMSLNTLANQRWDAEDTRGAVEAAQEAVKIYTDLELALPGVFTADRAMSLATVAGCLCADGQLEAAVERSFQAVAVYHGLTETEPRPVAADFARALRNLRFHLVAADRTVEALELIDTALACYAGAGDTLYPVTAELLTGRVMCLRSLERVDETLKPVRKLVRLARRHAGARSSQGPSELLDQLRMLSLFAFLNGRRTEATEAMTEAAALLRDLASHEPERYEPDLAVALGRLRNLLPKLARYDEAEIAAREAVDVRLRTAERGGASERVDVIAESAGLADLLMMRLHAVEALAAIDRALGHQARLTDDDLAIHGPAVELAQRSRGSLLLMLGREDEAVAVVTESVLKAERVAENVSTRTFGIVLARLAAGSVLTDLERREEALPHLERAAALCRSRTEAGEAGYDTLLATCLGVLGTCLALEPGDPEQALAATTEALEIALRHAVSDPEAVRTGLGRAMAQQGLRLAEAGRTEESLPLTAEAVALARELLETDRRAHVLELVEVLHSFAEARVQAGTGVESAAALDAVAEEIALLREVEEDVPHLVGQMLGKAEALRERLLGG
ncbi:tetratricopeptide repeat protein [Kitasatospora sp. NPDC051914]|uniref:tetratricopeptide repeat protein n=1 Tax=Kitasatospora sp. NPDC051914 TaxID=3154945 RepID=UPI003432B55B